MNKLIKLELKRNSLKSYYLAALITMITMLGLLYFFAAIPLIDSSEADTLFQSYRSLIGLNNIIGMAIFSIMSAVMASKFIVEDYTEKKAILIFSYPVDRNKILNAKIIMVFAFTVIAMLICSSVVMAIFFTTETLFPLCADTLNISVVISSLLSTLGFVLMSGLLGIISLWFGFLKKSVAVTIVAACIIASIACQIMALTISIRFFIIVILIVALLVTMFVKSDLQKQIRKLEL